MGQSLHKDYSQKTQELQKKEHVETNGISLTCRAVEICK